MTELLEQKELQAELDLQAQQVVMDQTELKVPRVVQVLQVQRAQKDKKVK